MLSSLGKALCCEIAEAYFFNHPIQPLKQDRKDRIFQSFIFSLSQNFRTHHSVSFYAAEQCLTPRYFSTIVREKSGRNALQWIMMFIIAEAKKLLSDPDPSIKEIAETLGFSTTSPSSAAISSNTSVSRRWHSAPPVQKSNARTKQGRGTNFVLPPVFRPRRTVVRPSRQRIIHASSSRR